MRITNEKLLRNTFYAQLVAFILCSLTSTIGSLVDGAIIGQYLGADSLAAFGIVSPLLTVYSVFGAIVSTGSRTRYIKLVGAGKTKEGQSVFSLACIVSGGTAAILMLVMLIFAGPVASLLGASDNAAELLPKATSYLIGISVGIPAMNLMKTLSGYMAIDGDRNLPVIASIVLTVSDIIFDLLVVFLHGDTFLIGLATSLSYYAALGVLLLHFRKKNILLRFTFRNLRWNETMAIIRKGIPAGVCRVAYTLRSAFMNHLLAVFASAMAIAAYSVHRQADAFLNPFTLGMADTVAVIAGLIFGEEDRPKMRKLLKIALQATLFVTTGIAVLVWLFAPQFSMLFIKDAPEAMNMSVTAVRCYAIGMPLYGINVIYQVYLQGIEKSKQSLVAGFLLEAGFMIISAGIMGKWLGADAVWYAFPVAQILMLLFYCVVVAVETRRLGIQNEDLLDKIILLPTTFDVPDSEQMEISVRNISEMVEASQAVWDFCDAHGCDKKRKTYLSLCVEEMSSNIIMHGFPQDPKRHIIHIRILKKRDYYIIRIRDNCRIFDPVKQLELYSDADLQHHMGLRMVARMNLDMKYTSVLGMNNLYIKV